MTRARFIWGNEAVETQFNVVRTEVLTALQQTRLDAGECIMIGDSAHDLLSGKGAGVKTAAVRWTHVPWEELIAVNPDYILETMSDLLKIVFAEQKEARS